MKQCAVRIGRYIIKGAQCDFSHDQSQEKAFNVMWRCLCDSKINLKEEEFLGFNKFKEMFTSEEFLLKATCTTINKESQNCYFEWAYSFFKMALYEIKMRLPQKVLNNKQPSALLIVESLFLPKHIKSRENLINSHNLAIWFTNFIPMSQRRWSFNVSFRN